jgi:ribonuclease J
MNNPNNSFSSRGNNRNRPYSQSREPGQGSQFNREGAPEGYNNRGQSSGDRSRNWRGNNQNYQSPYPSGGRGGNGGGYNNRSNNSNQNQQNGKGGVFAAVPQGRDQSLPAQAIGTLRIAPIGGQGELGRSCWIFEVPDEIVVIDAGIGFMPHGVKGGVDLILPNLDYLIDNKDKIKALVLSNPHEEYAGNLIDFINQLEIKEIYAPKILATLYKEQLPPELKFNNIAGNQKYKIGNSFQLTPLQVSFSTTDAYSFLIEAAGSRVLYTGAFKIDHTPPLAGTQFEVSRISSLVTERGVDLLISNSNNVESLGYANSESSVKKRLNEILGSTKGRVIALTGCSNTQRYEVLLSAAQKNGRKVCLVGEETKNWYTAAKEAQYLKYPDDLFVSVAELNDDKEANILVVIGSLEGDALKPFLDLAHKRHPEFALKEGDTIVVSVNPPLGTSRLLANAVDQLFIQGVSVIGGREAGVHAVAYASQEELKFMYNLARPKYFLPSHGEARQLVLHAELLGGCGVDPKNILIVDNGTTIDLSAGRGVELVGRIPANPVFFNKSLDSELNQQSIDERRNLGEDGTLTAVMALNFDKGQFVAGPTIKTLGSSFNKNKNWQEIEANMISDIRNAVDKALKNGQKEPGIIRHLTHDVLSKRIREKFGMSKPVVSIVVQEVH